MNKYNGSFKTQKADPFANIKKMYPKEFNDDPSWMFDTPQGRTPDITNRWKFK